MTANLNEDLPNSWECPRCVKTGSKNNNKHQKSKSTVLATNLSLLKKEDNVCGAEPPEKKIRLFGNDSPPSSEDEDEDNPRLNHKIVNSDNNHSFTNEDTDNSDSQTDALNYPKSFSMATNSSAHVRSCARFPLLSQGLKQISNPSNSSSSSIKNNTYFANNNNANNKSEVKGLAALMNIKKKNETSRDRLFKSIKGFINYLFKLFYSNTH